MRVRAELRAELEAWARQLSLEPGCVLQLVDTFHDVDLGDPWTFLLLELSFESNRAKLLRLTDTLGRAGTVSHENLHDLLDDLSSNKAGIIWRVL
jgi:hypothetical protein